MKRVAISSLVRGVRRRDVALLARALSVVEDNASGKAALLKRLASRRAHACVIGVTGSAGAGKSTLIEALAKAMRTDGRTVAILAVDPTSPKSGGAFLGDRMRMQSLAEDRGVFIRSMASRGASGGVARATKDAAALCAKAGFDFVVVETVGAGQLDYAVTTFADLTVLLLTPEAGDAVQCMKAGLRELVDVFVINKADRPGAQRLADCLTELEQASRRPVFQTVAERGLGVDRLYGYLAKARDGRR